MRVRSQASAKNTTTMTSENGRKTQPLPMNAYGS